MLKLLLCRYLGGVLDLTGELNRYSIARATARDREAVQKCRDLVDALMGRFLQFNLVSVCFGVPRLGIACLSWPALACHSTKACNMQGSLSCPTLFTLGPHTSNLGVYCHVHQHARHHVLYRFCPAAERRTAQEVRLPEVHPTEDGEHAV